MPFSHACAVIGVSNSSFHAYRNRHPAFAAQIEKAIADGVSTRLKVIEKASRMGDWRAAAWWLSNCSEHFAKIREGTTQNIAVGIKIVLPKKDELSEGTTIEIPEHTQ